MRETPPPPGSLLRFTIGKLFFSFRFNVSTAQTDASPRPQDGLKDSSGAEDTKFPWRVSARPGLKASLLNSAALKSENTTPKGPGGSFMTNMTLFPAQMG